MRHRPRDPNREPRVSAFDVALVFEPDLEQAAHLGDRRLLARQERTAHDQVLAGPRHRHILEPPALLPLGLALRLRRGGVADGRTEDAVGIRCAQRHAAVRRDEHVGQAASGALPALVGQDDHVELEPLGGVHRHEDDRVAALLGDRGLALPRGQRGLLVTEPDEALEVRAAHGLELGREPRELAEVGVAAVAVGHREAGQVVVVLGDDQLAQPLERDLPGPLDQAGESLGERKRQAPVGRRQARRRLVALERREDRPLHGRPPDAEEPVVGHADQRGGEHRQERHVVISVAKEPQIGEQV